MGNGNENTNENTPQVNYNNFNYKDDSILHKMKCPELRQIARHNHIKISGKKAELIERITIHFRMAKSAQKIQKIYRGYLMQTFKRLSGPAMINRKICINDSDFVTLEKIENLEWYNFFSYKDNDNMVYGFSLLSFVQYITNNNRNIRNPYNRNTIEFNIIRNAFNLFRNNKAIVGLSRYNLTSIRISLPNPYANYNISYSYYHPQIYYTIRITPQVRNLYNKMIEYRHYTLNQRIQNIFIEIDRLGNYTQSLWFSGLTSHCFRKFYKILRDIWSFRAGLTRDAKQKICCLYDPFQGILNSSINLLNQNDSENLRLVSHMKLLCVTAMETLIYTGIDEEHCKLGSLYCLMALTRVSHSARITMPWLYDAY